MDVNSGKTISYVVGDATEPQGEGNKVICHCCNDIGGWGCGFVVALSKKWKKPEEQYRKWFSQRKSGIMTPFELGAIQFVKVEKDIVVCNIIGQEGIYSNLDVPPIRYWAIEKGFEQVANIVKKEKNCSVHMPRIGCGLAGGEWSEIEAIIKKTLISSGISVTVYDLPN